MKRQVWIYGLIVAFLGLGTLRGQAPANSQAGQGSANREVPAGDGTAAPYNSATANGGNGEGAGGPPRFGPGLSSWIEYPRCNCCEPFGGNGPIFMETYSRDGFSFPLGNGIVGRQYNPGLWLQAGVRSLFFNPSADRAWTLDAGVSTVWYHSPHPPAVTVNNLIVAATTQIINGQTGATTFSPVATGTVQPGALNQSMLDLALGREWYLLGTGACTTGACPRCGQRSWRVGADLGGRWGTERLSLRNITGLPASIPGQTVVAAEHGHLTATPGGIFISVHTDLEIPTGCCLFFVGLRTEYGWAFNDILQSQNDMNVQSINVLLNFGLKF
jgi:hypothetical protein